MMISGILLVTITFIACFEPFQNYSTTRITKSWIVYRSGKVLKQNTISRPLYFFTLWTLWIVNTASSFLCSHFKLGLQSDYKTLKPDFSESSYQEFQYFSIDLKIFDEFISLGGAGTSTSFIKDLNWNPY